MLVICLQVGVRHGFSMTTVPLHVPIVATWKTLQNGLDLLIVVSTAWIRNTRSSHREMTMLAVGGS
jgi:hypothetical protein